MGFFSKLFKGPEIDLEKSAANAARMRELFDAVVPEGEKYRLIFGYTEDVSRFNYGFVHGSKTKIGNLIVGWDEACLLYTSAFLNERYGEGTVTVEITHTYRNMKEKILPVYEVITVAEEAIRTAGLTPVTVPIRGGTDGATLSYMGLPCPNLGTGGCNAHGRYECNTKENMEQCVQIVLEIVKGYAAL